MPPRRKKPRNYTIKGVTYFAHSEEEAFARYKKETKRVVETGDMLRIGNKFFRVIGELIHEIIPNK